MTVIRRILIILVTTCLVTGQSKQIEFALHSNGSIPVWLVAGPFSQPLTGFGSLGDSLAIPESEEQPQAGDLVKTDLVAGHIVNWNPVSSSVTDYLDINSALGFQQPADIPLSPSYGMAAYAGTYIYCEKPRSIVLSLGSYNTVKVYLNGASVDIIGNVRQAEPEQDKVRLDLHSGLNFILLKIFHSHHNYAPKFFLDTGWGWGVFARLLERSGEPVRTPIIIPDERSEIEFGLKSTFFFRDSTDGNLYQRFDLEITSPHKDQTSGTVSLVYNKSTFAFELSVPYGFSRHQLWLPAVEQTISTNCEVKIGESLATATIELKPQRRYDLHFMMIGHMDIGYTNPQPIVMEKQVRILNEVIDQCLVDENFKWTIETLWQLEQFEQSVSGARFQILVDLIKAGRIAVSPNYTNPFTGIVSEEEMLRSFDKSHYYFDKYGLVYSAMIFNDTPGMNWMIPRLLNDMNLDLLVCGINEVYTNNPIQRALPKVFSWQGYDNSSVITYLTTTYNEGMLIGLEKNFPAIEQRLWQYLRRLESDDYPGSVVLVNSAWGDNAGFPHVQYQNIQDWNEKYAYPRFVISNLDQFAHVFTNQQNSVKNTFRGDWTSSWETRYQGEPALIKKQRWTQHNINGAEILSAVNTLLNADYKPQVNKIDTVYDNLLYFSGHGSGLEYGFGNQEENQLTLDYRENYVAKAFLQTKELLDRGILRLSITDESFANEVIMVFNSLSWERDAIVTVDFSKEFTSPVQLIDMSDNSTVRCYTDGTRIIFSAHNLPSIGFKKFKLIRNAADNVNMNAGDLSSGENYIANQYYQISFSETTGSIQSIYDKVRHKEIIDRSAGFSFAAPLMFEPLSDRPATKLEIDSAEINITELGSVGLEVTVSRISELFNKSTYSLYSGSDRIEISHTIDLLKLKQSEQVQEFGFYLPLNLEQNEVTVDLAGGPINAVNQILPGAETGYYSVRQYFSAGDPEYSVYFGLPDSRIIKGTPGVVDSNKPLAVILANNFPEQWNRSERNDSELTFRMLVTTTGEDFEIIQGEHFGWEVNSDPVVIRTWQRSEGVTESYFKTTHPEIQIVTVGFTSVEPDEFYLRIKNINPDDSVKGIIKSRFFRDCEVSVNNQKKKYWVKKDAITVELTPNEMQTVLVKR